MNLFNKKIFFISIIFGLIALIVIVTDIFFTIPGTNLLTDPREIFVTIGAAITGPIGGILIGILASIYDPTKDLVFYITFQHIIGAFLTALFYKKLIYEKLAMPAFLLGWGLLMFCYYFIFYLPGFTFVYFFFPDFYKLIVQGEFSFFESLIRIFNGWIPEFLFTTILTSLIFIGLPEKFRKPLWGKSFPHRAKGISFFNNTLFDFGRLKNFLAIRLVIWFLILALIPILFIGVSIKQDVTTSILEHEGFMRQAMAAGYKQRLIDLPVKESIKFLKQAQLALEGSLFIIDSNGKYQLVSDSTKDHNDARFDYGSSIIDQILQLKDGKIIDNDNLISFGFATFVTKSHELTIIVTSNVKRVQTISSEFESSVYKKLGLGILIIALTLIVIIFVLIRIPLSNLTKAMDKFGAGDYNAHITEDKLYDEIKVLASSFNLMAQKITSSNRNLEIEISERKEIEKELSESELRWKFALEGAGDGIWDWNIVSDEVYFSYQWKRMIGFEEDEIPNTLNEWKKRVHPEDLEKCLKEIQEHFDQQTKFYENEHRLLCKDGSYKWILDRGIAIERDVSGKPLRMIGTHRDISKRKKDEQIQRAVVQITEASFDSENISEFYSEIHRIISSLMYAENLFIAILNKKENIISFPYYKDQYDESPSSHVPGNGLTEYLFREDKIQLIRENIFNQLVSNSEVELDGSPSVDWLGVPFRIDEYLSGAIVVQSYDEKIRLGQNESELLSLVSTQVSAAIHRKMSEEALKESEERFKKIFEDSSNPIILLKDGKFIQYNKASLTILGYNTREDLIGKTPSELSPEFQPDGQTSSVKAVSMINEAISTGNNFFEWVHKRKDGTNFFVEVALSPIVLHGEELIHVTWRDLTQRKLAQEELIASEKKYREMTDLLPQIVFETDISGRFTFVNRVSFDVFGYTQEDLSRGVNVLEVLAPEEHPRAIQNINDILHGKASTGNEYIGLKKDGTQVPVLIYTNPIIKYGKPVGLRGIVIDITENKRAEEEIVKVKMQLQNVLHAATEVSIIATDIDGTITLFNTGAEKMLGYKAEEVIGKCNPLFFHLEEELKQKAGELFNEHNVSVEGFEIFIFNARLYNSESKEWTYLKKDNGKIKVNLVVTAVKNQSNQITGYLGIATDITKGKEAEVALMENEEKFRSLVQGLNDAIFIVDLNGIIIYQSPSSERLIGYKPDEMIGHNCLEFVYFEDLPYVQKEFELVLNSKNDGKPTLYRVVKKNGELVYVDSTGINLLHVPSINGIALFVRNVNEQVVGQQKLKAAFEYIQYVVDSIAMAIISVDQDFIVTHSNNAAQKFSESTELKEGHIIEVFPKLNFIQDELLNARKMNDAVMDSKMVFNEFGDANYYSIAIFPLTSSVNSGFVIIVENTTEQTKFAEIMIQSEKMITVAGLAAGMAHEINNPLGTIVQGCQNIVRRVSTMLPKNNETAERLGVNITQLDAYFKERQIYEIIESMRTAASKASEIIKNMLQFSRRGESKRVIIGINRIIDESIELAYNDYDLRKRYDFRSFEIIKEIEPDLPDLKITITEIEQVIFNIIKNAAQAINEGNDLLKRPKITIRAFKEEEFLRLEIEDNGPGISEKVKNRIFEPFFTTKDVGEGTGLGLSVSYMIITENHHGKIHVESSLGHGARFIIRLPLSI
jgi:PAS domain S-box-containing protein